MSQLAIAPLLVAIATAVVTIMVRRSYRVTVAVSLGGGVMYTTVVALLFHRVATDGPIAYQLGAWPAPFGITIVADALSTFMLTLAAAVSLGALVFSVRSIDRFGQRLSYHSLFHLMIVGVTGSFLTGDIFNLFVWFEVMLMASYVLVVFYSGPEHTRAALTYVVLNLIGSAVMLLAIGGLYAVTGTLNMADLANRLAQPGRSVTPVLGLSALLFAVFALKAGIVPFQFWVPDAYRAAPAPVAAVLAGVVKKVGVYAIIRLHFTVFSAMVFPGSLPLVGGRSILAFYGPVLFVMAAASILLGGLWAVDRPDLDGMLAYSSIGQVGFIVIPLAVGATVTEPGLRSLAVAAALVYTVGHGLAKSLLFLTSGAIDGAIGSTRFRHLGGIAETDPTIAGGFIIGGLALIGIPPLVGFFGKFYVFELLASARADLALAVVLVGAILTIVYISSAWNRAFWGPPTEAGEWTGTGVFRTAVVVVFALGIVGLGVGFDPVAKAATAGATAALDRGAYIELVLGGGT